MFVMKSLVIMAGLLPALASTARVQESDQVIQGTVLSVNAPIEVKVSPELDIKITDVKLSAMSTKFDGGSFTMKNLSDKALIAYSVVLNLYFDTDPDHPMQMRLTEDGWFLNQYVLKPGESKERVIRTALTSTNPGKLARVTVVPDYIEFSGGKASGANSSVVGAALSKSRNIKAGLLQKYSAKLQSGESVSSVTNLLKSDLQEGNRGESARQVGIGELLTLLKLDGSESFAKRLLEAPATRAY